MKSRKRIAALVAALAALVLIIVLCVLHTPREFRPTGLTAPQYDGDVALEIDWAKGRDTVLARLENSGEDSLCDISFRIEKLEEGIWQIRSIVTTSGDPDTGGGSLAPGQSSEWEISAKSWVYRLGSGTYRVVCSFATELQPDAEYCIIKEFVVE